MAGISIARAPFIDSARKNPQFAIGRSPRGSPSASAASRNETVNARWWPSFPRSFNVYRRTAWAAAGIPRSIARRARIAPETPTSPLDSAVYRAATGSARAGRVRALMRTSSAERPRFRRLNEYRVMNRRSGTPAGNPLIASIPRAAFVVARPCGVWRLGSLWFEFDITTESRIRLHSAGSFETSSKRRIPFTCWPDSRSSLNWETSVARPNIRRRQPVDVQERFLTLQNVVGPARGDASGQL